MMNHSTKKIYCRVLLLLVCLLPETLEPTEIVGVFTFKDGVATIAAIQTVAIRAEISLFIVYLLFLCTFLYCERIYVF